MLLLPSESKFQRLSREKQFLFTDDIKGTTNYRGERFAVGLLWHSIFLVFT